MSSRRSPARCQGCGAWDTERCAITPEAFRTIPCPSYPEIRLALFAGRQVARTLNEFAPDAVHIATEGPLGQSARSWCLRTDHPFTTSYHTQFPEYVRARYPVPESWTYAFLRRFHGKAARMMVSTDHMRRRLEARGFRNIALWTRGVDVGVFRAYPRDLLNAARPILLYAGRVAVEKNLEAFLELDVPGTKYVVGGGPALEALGALRFSCGRLYRITSMVRSWRGTSRPRTHSCFRAAPTRSASCCSKPVACGTPIAAFPVVGPIDVVKEGISGCLHEDLREAIEGALKVDRDSCRHYALGFTWERATQQFFGNLQPRSSAAGAQVLAARTE